jgi:hypothetical protein
VGANVTVFGECRDSAINDVANGISSGGPERGNDLVALVVVVVVTAGSRAAMLPHICAHATPNAPAILCFQALTKFWPLRK